jgi:alpha-tubulin suppressor-like RCC1 family protein
MLIRSIIIHSFSMHHHLAALPTREKAWLYAKGNRAEEDLAYPEYQQYTELPAMPSDDEGSTTTRTTTEEP